MAPLLASTAAVTWPEAAAHTAIGAAFPTRTAGSLCKAHMRAAARLTKGGQMGPRCYWGEATRQAEWCNKDIDGHTPTGL